MERKDSKLSLSYDEEAITHTTNQIRDAYESGVMDQPDRQYHYQEQDERL